MRYFLATLMLLAMVTAGFAESRVKQIVKHYPHLRVVYVRTSDGKQMPVITNLDKNGKPMGPRVPPAPDWTRMYGTSERQVAVTPTSRIIKPRGVERTRRKRATTPGIPIPPGRNPNRAINPYRTVNPYKDPTAIPSPP
jgi:hypothetical protein